MNVLSKENLEELRNGKTVKLMVDINDNKCTNITIRPKSGKFVITGRAFKKNPKIKIGNTKQHSTSDIDVIDELVVTMARGFDVECREGKRSQKGGYNKGSIGDFSDRVMDEGFLMDPKVWGVRKNGKYLAESTIKNAVTYFAYTLGGIYEQCGRLDVSEDLMQEYKNKEIDRVVAQKNKKNTGEDSRDSKANTINDRWRYAEEVRQLLIEHAPDNGPWPMNPLPIDERVRCDSPDLLKIISYEKSIKAATVVYRACEMECQEAFASSGEVYAGARVGESDAMRVGLFEYHGDLCRYYIDEQIDMNGELTHQLKNEYSHRYIHIFGPFKKIVEMKREQLQARGLSEEEINRAFLGSSYDDPFTPLRKSDVSAFMKEVLELVGCTKEEINLLQKIAVSDAGTDSDNDLSAHVFRRTFATLAVNGGIPENEVDALLGHDNKKNVHRGFSGWDFAEKIVGKLSRCLVYGKLAPTINPAYQPIMLNNNKFHLCGNRIHKFVTKCDGYLSFSIETMESDDSMIILLNNQSLKLPIDVSEWENCETARLNKEVLPELPRIKEINKWIDEAMCLDISHLIRKGARNHDNITE